MPALQRHPPARYHKCEGEQKEQDADRSQPERKECSRQKPTKYVEGDPDYGQDDQVPPVGRQRHATLVGGKKLCYLYLILPCQVAAWPWHPTAKPGSDSSTCSGCSFARAAGYRPRG